MKFISKIFGKLFYEDTSKNNIVMEDNFRDVIQNAIDKVLEISRKENFTAKFRNKNEYDAIVKSYDSIFKQDSLIYNLTKITFDNNIQIYKYRGFCHVCGKETEVNFDSNWGNGTEGAWCNSCNINLRLRLMYKFLKENYKKGMKVYTSEFVTEFFRKAKELIPDIVGSEYLADNDERRKTIRHEDCTKLSFPDSSFDLYISNDVLEHVFDYKNAFSEAFRILSPGGKFLFHVPFHFYTDKTIIRAKIERGGVIHLKAPIYHGNPTDVSKGALCVNDFSFDILDDLRRIGFRDVFGILVHDYGSAFMNSNSVIFIAIK